MLRFCVTRGFSQDHYAIKYNMYIVIVIYTYISPFIWHKYAALYKAQTQSTSCEEGKHRSISVSLQSGSLAPSTPLTGRVYLKEKDLLVTPVSSATQSVSRLQSMVVGLRTAPSEQLMQIFKSVVFLSVFFFMFCVSCCLPANCVSRAVVIIKGPAPEIQQSPYWPELRHWDKPSKNIIPTTRRTRLALI